MELKLPEKVVRTKIFFIRYIAAHLSGQKAMPDEDLVLLYQVETKRLNEQVHTTEFFSNFLGFMPGYQNSIFGSKCLELTLIFIRKGLPFITFK